MSPVNKSAETWDKNGSSITTTLDSATPADEKKFVVDLRTHNIRHEKKLAFLTSIFSPLMNNKANFDLLEKSIVFRGMKMNLTGMLQKYKEISDFRYKLDEVRKESNKLANDISTKKISLLEGVIEKGRSLKKLEVTLTEDLSVKVDEIYTEALNIPNIVLPDVKIGKNESENDILRTWGDKRDFDFQPKDYLELGEALDIIDVKRAAKVSGPRFGYLKGAGALLEFALVNLAMETLVKEGFVPVVPPVLIKKEVMGGMGYLEHGGEEDMYVFDKDGLVLVGTSEQSIGPMYLDETLDGSQLPIRHLGFSTCFRREAGSYGKDTKGILRVHQFDKIEMFSFTKPEWSDREHDYFLATEEKLFQILEIPYQVIKMCSGDLGTPAARKYDLEAWMPGQETYREVTSTSSCTDYQARRLNIKYKGTEDSGYVHTLNGTAFAVGRTIIAILENYQQKDGSVLIPKALQKYLGFDKLPVKS